MRSYLFPLALAIIVLTACASGGYGTYFPTPSDVVISAPASDLAPELAAFSGTWEGAWDGEFPIRIIIEQIDATTARVVSIRGAQPKYVRQAGWERYSASVLPGGKIEWGKNTRFIFTMSKDRTSIFGERESQGRIKTVTMKKVIHQ
jgi:hypothetical protein